MRIKLIVFLAVTAINCTSNEKEKLPNSQSFYYWKSTFENDSLSLSYLNSTKKIYLKYFDVAWKNEPIPIAKITFNDTLPSHLEVIPTIYIKNVVFLKINKVDIQKFAKNVNVLVNEMSKKNNISKVKEIQFDCDWTLKSKSNFFEFLNNFKTISKSKISCTIRLHQVKYSNKTGVPPCDEGILMFYNMGNLKDSTKNSIYNPKDAEKYLQKLNDYPLKLGVALPIFQWTKVFRQGKLVRLVAKLDEKKLQSKSDFIKISENNYKVKKGMYFAGNYLKKNDLLVLEQITNKDLKMASKQLKSHFDKTADVIYYDLDPFNLKHFSNEELLEITATFH